MALEVVVASTSVRMALEVVIKLIPMELARQCNISRQRNNCFPEAQEEHVVVYGGASCRRQVVQTHEDGVSPGDLTYNLGNFYRL